MTMMMRMISRCGVERVIQVGLDDVDADDDDDDDNDDDEDLYFDVQGCFHKDLR